MKNANTAAAFFSFGYAAAARQGELMNKKFVSLSMSALMAVSLLGGCAGNGESAKKEKPEMPVYTTSETFRVGNWGVPPHENTGYMEYANNPNYCTVEEWTKMRDCGFNLAIPTEGVSVKEICRDLEMADAVGMKVLVRDQTSAGFETIIKFAKEKGYTYDETREELEKRSEEIKAHIDEYKKYKSFQGVNAFDEPSMDYYEAIAACQDWFLKYYPEYEFYSNLLPVYATPKQLFGASDGKGYAYPDYVGEFVKTVNPESLSYDHYPILQDWDESAYIKEDFLYNLNVFAKQAKKKNTPVYIYLQTMGFFSNLPITTYEEFAWQCYTSLSFGVRGIMCFQYWTQLQAQQYNNVRDGIVDRDGTITPLYYKVQEVFDEIEAMQDVYLHYRWDGVRTYEGGRVINDMFTLVSDQLEKLEEIEAVECDEDIIVGQFKDDAGYAYMVTNASVPFEPKNANVKLTFGKEYDYAMVVKKGTRSLVELEDHVLSMTLGSGEGYFVVPVK